MRYKRTITYIVRHYSFWVGVIAGGFVLVLLLSDPKTLATKDTVSPPKESVRDELLQPLVATTSVSTYYANGVGSYPQPQARDLAKKLQRQIVDRKQEFIEQSKSAFENRINNAGTPSARPEWRMEYQVYKSPHTVTYVFEEYAYLLGAHGITNYMVRMYTNNGELVTLQDLLEDAANLERFASLTKRKLKDKLVNSGVNVSNKETLAWIKEGTAPEWQNYDNVYLTNDNIVVLFEPYQIASYAAGTIRVKLPYSKVNFLLSEQFRVS